MTTKVKICGLTRIEDVRCAVEAAADYVGFILYPKSPRFVTLDTLSGLTAEVPQHVARVAVMVNPAPEEVRRAIEAGNLDVVQFHGEEDLRSWNLPDNVQAWKALPLGTREHLQAARSVGNHTLVVDAASTKGRGGTGERCNWDLAAELARERTVVLAGGLTPDNVAQAIARVHPFGVDVSSGVEDAPGQKNHTSIAEFIGRARSTTLEGA